MPTRLGPAFPPSFNGYPKHMSTEDYEIWLRYWPTIKPQALALYFDVGLGTGAPAPDDTDPKLRAWWTLTTQKRADVIIETADQALLIELRFLASPNSLGRLATYRHLLEQDNPLGLPITPILVTNQEDPDTHATATALGISYVIA